MPKSWDAQLAKKYEDSLFKEFAVCDLKHYKSGNVCVYTDIGMVLVKLMCYFARSPCAGARKMRSCLELAKPHVVIPAVRTMI